MINNVDSPYEYIPWDDNQVSSKCASVLYDFKDFAKYYAFAYVSFNIKNLVSMGNYKELGEIGSNISSFVCFGNNNLCICFLNTETRDIVRRMTINYFMITGIFINESPFDASIKLFINDDIINIKIPNSSMGTALKHQKQMKKNILDFISTLNKIEK